MGHQKPPTGEININPWQAILNEIKQGSYRAAWTDERLESELKRERELQSELETAGFDLDEIERMRLDASKEIRAWLETSRKEHQHVMTTSTKAVSLGLSERYIESVRAEAQMIARVLSRALEAADVSDEQKQAAMDELRVALGEVSQELRARGESTGLPMREIGD